MPIFENSIFLCCRFGVNIMVKLSPKVKGRICRAGQIYAHILPDGQVVRCSFGGGPINKNFFDDSFSLLNEPSACTSEYCGCLEWVVEKM
jgi:hypothetical protein